MKDGIGSFELMILLALIRLGDEAYGVPIAKEIEARSGREVSVASVYAALERLTAKQLVSSELGEPTAERGGRAERYFRITAKGMREVRDTRRVLVKFWEGLPKLERGRS
jgi:PadR family transcriptional regulator PadR